VKITVLSHYDRIALYHSLTPFLMKEFRHNFTFTNSPEYCLGKDRNTILIMVRQFLKPDRVDHDFLEKARKKYDRIAFFNGNAGGGIPRLEVLPYVDLFYSKALFKDKSLYGKKLYGGELYTQYFHERDNISDDHDRDRRAESDPEQLNKLRLSWNIGIGEFPRRKYIQRAGVALARATGMGVHSLLHSKSDYSWNISEEKTIPVHARILLTDKNTISYQRKLMLDMIQDKDIFLTGSTGQKQYNQEIGASRMTLSPFGWGELCIRDFEAILGESLLLKPDMSHLETWPDVFFPGETYVPLKWDASDLLEKTEYYLSHEQEQKEICQSASDVYKTQRDQLSLRFSGILKEIQGLKETV
jgi:hypothetical protein